MRHGTGSNTRNQNRISVLDFGSQTFLFPSVSPIKSQNCSELRKAFSSQDTLRNTASGHTGGEKGRRETGRRPPAPSSDLYFDAAELRLARGRKQLPQSWCLAGNLTHLRTTLKCSTVFFGTRKQKYGSLEIRAAGNGNSPFYLTFLTLLNYKELESWHNDSFLRHNTSNAGDLEFSEEIRGRKGGRNNICIFHMLLLVEAFVIKLYIQKFTG